MDWPVITSRAGTAEKLLFVVCRGCILLCVQMLGARVVQMTVVKKVVKCHDQKRSASSPNVSGTVVTMKTEYKRKDEKREKTRA